MGTTSSTPDLIRKMWDTDPNLKPADIAAALRAQGVILAVSDVAGVISRHRKTFGLGPIGADGNDLVPRPKKKKKARPQPVQSRPEPVNSARDVVTAYQLLLEARELVGTEALNELFEMV